jgi:hypothetical protein
MDDEKGPSESKFNAAIASIQRIHELLQAVNYYSCACKTTFNQPEKIENLVQWRNNIMQVYKECYGHFNPKERDIMNLLFDSEERLGPMSKNKYNAEGDSFMIFNSENFYKHTKALDRLEMKLREIAHNHKLLIPNADDQRFAMAH